MDEALSRFPLSAFPGATAGRPKTNMLFYGLRGFSFVRNLFVLTVQLGDDAVVFVKPKTVERGSFGREAAEG